MRTQSDTCTPHQNWFILAADFGDPFKYWNNWDTADTICRAGTEYPFSNYGCSFTDTFGQNFIVILVVLFVCLLLNSVVIIRNWRQARQHRVEPRGAPQEEAVKTKALNWLDKASARLGYAYILRWLAAMQPSILFFSILDFRTTYTQSRLAFGTFLSSVFFIYYFTMATLTTILSVKVWRSPGRATQENQSMEELALKEGGIFKFMAFQYCDMKVPKYYWQLLYPAIDFLRTMVFSVFLVAVDNGQVSSGLIFLVELIRFTYQQLLFTKKLNLYFSIVDAITGVLMFLYLIIKLSTTTTGKEIASIQDAGKGISGLIILFWILTLVDIIYSTVLVVIALVRGPSTVQQSGFKMAHNQEVTTTMHHMTEFHDNTNKINMSSSYRMDPNERNEESAQKPQLVKAVLGREHETPGDIHAQRNAYRLEHDEDA